jgi:hypothetical protein
MGAKFPTMFEASEERSCAGVREQETVDSSADERINNNDKG